MPFPRIRIGTNQYFHTLALINKSVGAASLEYDVTVTPNIDECTLKVMSGEFDAGEFSLATFIKICEKGSPHEGRFVGLPVFAKKLVSQYAFCRADDTLDGHGSLAGRRIAVPQLWVTAAIWHRLFMEQAGVDPSSVTWCPLKKDRIEGMPYPESMNIDWSLLGGKPGEVLREKRADCFIFARRPPSLKGLRYLSKKPIEAALETVRSTGIIPPTHVLAVRRDLIDANPGLAEALLGLFNDSLAAMNGEIGHQLAQYLPLADMQFDAMGATLGEGWNAHGWKANERSLRAFCDAAVRQGFVGAVDIDRCFKAVG